MEVRGQGSQVRGKRQLPGDQLVQESTLSDLWLQEVWQQSEREPGANHSPGPEHRHRKWFKVFKVKVMVKVQGRQPSYSLTCRRRLGLPPSPPRAGLSTKQEESFLTADY